MGWSTGEMRNCNICGGEHNHTFEYGSRNESGHGTECFDCGVYDFTMYETHSHGNRYEKRIVLTDIDTINDERINHNLETIDKLDVKGKKYVDEYGYTDIEWEETEELESEIYE
tara:strand:+ start:930 stop:1271 length:342 start_codon:yes stop_codon:yes gene_type:complete